MLKSAYAPVPCSAMSRPSASSASDTLRPTNAFTNSTIKHAPMQQNIPATPITAAWIAICVPLAKPPNIPTARVPHMPQNR